MGRPGWEGRRCSFCVSRVGVYMIRLYSIVLDTFHHRISLHFWPYHFVKDQSSFGFELLAF
jgi:hypothetical protein